MIEPTTHRLLRQSIERVYHNAAPHQAELPYVVLQSVSAVREPTMDGTGGWVRSRIQASCYAATYRQAKELARDLRQLTDGHSEVEGGNHYVFNVADERDIPTDRPEGSELPVFGVSVDLMITATE